MNKASKICFIIPVFNKENIIELVYKKITHYIVDELKISEYEFIFIDDGSTDNSKNELLKISNHDHRVTVLQHIYNKGQMKALETGIKLCNTEVLFMATCDLQNPFDSIIPLYNAIINGFDVSIAFRKNTKMKSISSYLSRIFFSLLRLFFPKIPPGGFDYGAMSPKVYEQFKLLDFEKIVFQLEVFLYADKIFYYPITRENDTISKSGWSFIGKILYSLKTLNYISKRKFINKNFIWL